MDDRDWNGWGDMVQLAEQELKRDDLTFEQKDYANETKKKYRAQIADLIPPGPDGTTIPDRNWSIAHACLQAVWQSDDSQLVDCLPPAYVSQDSKRRRVESQDGLMFRPFFRDYEERIFGKGDESVDAHPYRIFGLTGPQGFGKSVFLHCLAIKRSSNNLVVWIPLCPSKEKPFKQVLATAFYSGCKAHALTGIPYMKFSYSIYDFLREMLTFASQKNKSLFLIVDQMNRHLGYFEELKSALVDVFGLRGNVMHGHRVLMSASTSGTTEPIFGRSCVDLQVFDHVLSNSEITLLSSKFPSSPNLEFVQDKELSFLHAVDILGRDNAIDLEEDASAFFSKLRKDIAKARTSNTANAIRSEYMRVLHMIVTGEVSSLPITFDTTLVDGDLFFVKKSRYDRYVIREHRQGFSAHVLQKIREDEDHHSYLTSVINTRNFGSISRAAQGHILEDAIKMLLQTLLQNKSHPLRFPLTGLDGQKRKREIDSFELKDKRWVQSFSTVPTTADLNGWNPKTEWYVGLPREGFTGVDFVLARMRCVGRTAKLEIFYIETTVSPEAHGIKKSEEQKEMEKELRKKCVVTKRNTKLYATLLTPLLGSGSWSSNMEYIASECYHSHFQAITGQDPLVKVVSERCKEVWGY